MNKEEYYKWVDENDTYPKHSHQWIVKTYTKINGTNLIHRNFGTFTSANEAKKFIDNYKKKYTTPGFISAYSIQALCEVISEDTSETVP